MEHLADISDEFLCDACYSIKYDQMDIIEVIDFGDSDIEIYANNVTFKSHKRLIYKFTLLRGLIESAESTVGCLKHPGIAVDVDKRGVEDFKNMFKILYASIIEGPFTFSIPVLISALRVSTNYEYPGLRNFSIANLERHELPSALRIHLAHEFGFDSWRELGYVELSLRESPITREEARLMKIEDIVQIAKTREKMQHMRGEETLREANKNEQNTRVPGSFGVEASTPPAANTYGFQSEPHIDPSVRAGEPSDLEGLIRYFANVLACFVVLAWVFITGKPPPL